MDTFDLSVAFYEKLAALTYSGMKTLLPEEIFDATEGVSSTTVRRGMVLLNSPDTIGFGEGVYSRITGIYQIDLWVPRKTTSTTASATQQLKKMSDAHVDHFFPENGRGLTLTENSTSAHILRRPNQRSMQKEGAYLRDIVEVDFFVDDFPSA